MAEKNPYLILAITLLFLLFGTCCKTTPAGKFTGANKSKKGKQQDTAQSSLPSALSMQIPIGTVHMVDEKGKFVLIKSRRSTNLDPETKIITYRSDATLSSNLKVSPARKGAYLTADLVDGMPSVGDMVMMVQTANKNKPDSSNPPGGPPSDVQVLE